MDNLGLGSPSRHFGYCVTVKIVSRPPSRVPLIGVMRKWPPKRDSDELLADVHRTNLRLRCACCSESANQRPKKSLGVLASHNERQHPSTRKFWEDVLKRTDELVDTESLTLCVSGSRVERFCCRSALAQPNTAIVYIQNDSRDFINSHDQRITGDKQVDGHSQYISILEHIVLEIAC
ncbi:hypothetical protein L226DRAFT_527513 [Lentinus tigrinus ALCF2SS1-7]|uniref:uncharacterized protein n=1 Tax=Lentinus tigrinus ALCF2SS1-7 TaxID=1328758 RepID=UPI001165F515|nr:hypothetical protein L226DRAFT_527513 [Lentinus tigrinus ALCF2SS1-7]